MRTADAAAVLADNLAARNINPTDLETTADLPTGLGERILIGDPTAYPCPKQLQRIALALGTTTRDLLTAP